jgi:hypothetical protein
MVIKESLRSYDVIYSLGGSEKTKAILPKLARSTFLKAAIKLDKPLRLSIFPKLAAKKAGLNFLDRLSGLVDVRLARSKAGDYQKSVISTGVSEQIKLVLSQTDTGEPFGSRYDSEYVTWQIGRCPEIVPFTCIVAGDAGSYAAILFWRHSESIDFCRLAIIGSSRVTITEVGTALDYVLDYITGLGGGLVSILVSHMQTELLRLLRTKGFIASRLTLPLFILARGQADNCGELAELSYLDTDLGYRFSLVTGD